MENSRVTEVLRSVPLFSSLTAEELDEVVGRTRVRACAAGEMLFCEGDPCTGFYIVARGRVRISKNSPSGREQTLAVEGPGGSIAELPVFDGAPYPASATAVEASEVLFISRGDFRSLCLEHPEVGLKVIAVVGARLRRLVGIIEELSFTTVRHRLISWILRQSKTQGARFALGASHQALAAEIGTVRELVSRNLARLQAEGFIAMEGREVAVLNAEGLEAELSSLF